MNNLLINFQLNNFSQVTNVIISLAIILFTGFLFTRITKLLRLPNVTAYIVAGIVIGPYCFNLVPESVIEGSDFISDIALAFIAFSTGEYFIISNIKKDGKKNIVITIFEALVAFIVVFIVMFFILKLDLVFSIVLASLSTATAPASTLMTIRQTNAKGDFVNTLLQVVALDDIVCLITFSIGISVAVAKQSGEFNFVSIIKPILLNIAILIIGGIFGLILKLLIPEKRSKDNKLIICIACLFSFCGICAIFGVSPLLGCMSMGMVYINLSKDDKLFKQINYFSPPILLIFFVRSGMVFKIDALFNNSLSFGSVSLALIGIVYFSVRIFGKYGGAFLGSMLVKKSNKIRNYLGFALIPQAGVAIGLVAFGARVIGGTMGDALQTIILSSSILYELIGPACAKFALFKSNSYSNNLDELTLNKLSPLDNNLNEVELLIKKINLIQKELPEHVTVNEDEEAFVEAAEDQYLLSRTPYLINKRRFYK